MRNKLSLIHPVTKRRITTLVFLIFFVLVILFVSMVIAGFISYSLFEAGVIPPLEGRRFPVIFAFMVLVSLIIGTSLAYVAGRHFVRPLRTLSIATKEVAAGRFDVVVPETGPDEMKRLAKSFNQMTRGLSSIETLRNDFVDNISHEFKTPIVSISGFAKLLKKNNLSESERSEYLDIIISESNRLAALSSNVLLLSKIENIDFVNAREEFSLDEQLRRIILPLEPQMQSKNIDIKLSLIPTDVFANEELLRHVWTNILSNAIKFSWCNGEISIKMRPHKDKVEVSISDKGIGMNEETVRYMFDKFYQADSSRATEGNGLGLSLVKRIIELNNGTIAVKSIPDEGTNITVVLDIENKKNDR